MEEEIVGTREAPSMRGRGSQPELREEQAGSFWGGGQARMTDEAG